MDELIKQISAKTGLNADQAKGAADAVINYLKAQLPSPIAGQIDSLLNSGSNADDGAMGSVSGALGGRFGKK